MVILESDGNLEERLEKKAEINYLPKKSFRDQKYSYLTQQKNKSFFLEIIPIGEG